MKINGRLRHTSIQIPTGPLSHGFLEIRPSASRRPKIIDSTMQMTAISMLTRNPLKMNSAFFPPNSHLQLSGSNR
jgi:hypothetical protein